MANSTLGLVGRKVGMTQIFKEDGESVAVTVLEAGPCVVLQVKTTDGNDGYNAIQLGFGSKKESRITKADKGHLEKANAAPVAAIQEFRLEADAVSKYGTRSNIECYRCIYCRHTSWTPVVFRKDVALLVL